jgi:hypothetical protein
MDIPTENKNKTIYSFIGLIIFLILVLYYITTKKSLNSDQAYISEILAVLCFSLLIVGICITLLPSFKDIRSLFEQISNVSYVILYTIFLILFFTMTSVEIINMYAIIIVPLTILLGGFMFYKSIKSNDKSNDININTHYERIKSIILFFCLISIFSIYYIVDPGGFIQKYFGYSLLLTIIISVFALLYLIIVLTNGSGSVMGTPSLLFLAFITIITIYFSMNPFENKTVAAASIIIVLLICILWGILIGGTIEGTTFNLFKQSLTVLFGIVISGLIILWIVYNIQSSSYFSFILNLLLVILALGLIYKIIMPSSDNSKKNTFLSLVLSILFYIPCLATDVISSTENSHIIVAIMLLIVILFAYYKVPNYNTPFTLSKLQGGTQLIDKPIYTDKQHSLGSYLDLNPDRENDYQYAISCWIFIEAAAPNNSKYVYLLNFGEKPNILYNGELNTLMITMDQHNLNKHSKHKLIDFDEHNNRILFKKEQFLLQKWNNIIINYNGGVLDIFINGELVKSDIGVVPYYKLDNLTVGQDDGIKGGIKKVVYFKQPLSAPTIYYLYNLTNL